MSDLIRRQDAIRLAEQGQIQGFEWQFKKLCELPSTEPKRKTGEWIFKHCVWFCSECGENPTKGHGYVQGHDELYDFCPNCGADMTGGEDG